MKKRLFVGLGVVLAVAGVAVWLEPTRIVLGWMNGEAFYRNRPTRYWREALTSSDPKIQVESHQALEKGGAAAVPVLAEMLHGDDKPEARWRAADLLRQMGPDAKEATGALGQALRDADSHVRAVAAAALADIGPAASDAIPLLRDMLATEDRLPALRALARCGSEAAPAIASTIDLLRDDQSEVRWNAARTLGRIGPDARPAAPALVAALKDSDALVREHAAESLGQIGLGSEKVVTALAAVLKDPDARVRRDAVRSLGQIGPAAKSAVEDIRPLLRDKDEKVRKAAKTAMRLVDNKE